MCPLCASYSSSSGSRRRRMDCRMVFCSCSTEGLICSSDIKGRTSVEAPSVDSSDVAEAVIAFDESDVSDDVSANASDSRLFLGVLSIDLGLMLLARGGFDI